MVRRCEYHITLNHFIRHEKSTVDEFNFDRLFVQWEDDSATHIYFLKRPHLELKKETPLITLKGHLY